MPPPPFTCVSGRRRDGTAGLENGPGEGETLLGGDGPEVTESLSRLAESIDSCASI